jgi:hypothetical protein
MLFTKGEVPKTDIRSTDVNNYTYVMKPGSPEKEIVVRRARRSNKSLDFTPDTYDANLDDCEVLKTRGFAIGSAHVKRL